MVAGHRPQTGGPRARLLRSRTRRDSVAARAAAGRTRSARTPNPALRPRFARLPVHPPGGPRGTAGRRSGGPVGRVRSTSRAPARTPPGAPLPPARRRPRARLAFDPSSRAYRLFNESGSNPTFVRRGGRSLRVTARDPRGMRVETGDEVQLGRAVLKLAIGDR